MPFDITVTRVFAAAHQLRLYDGSLEPLHGHNWKLAVTVTADQLDTIGVVMDFHELERRVAELVDSLHNSHLNDHPAFAGINPSTENVCLYIAKSLDLPPSVSLTRVDVWETETCQATYRPVGAKFQGESR